ncbi:hypothetical protein [Vibrio harveyi]|uniref:hypothetical protein n=1 Tax=Vibrio harveyi TaxID=669 RepID=UPI00155918E9|nr:hypothetical protein [Vibrio harveyi]HDM8150532.1 hypothetical protein [Vibrio harveyi]HDM8193145.1 hypothetical protein [Vibrio harveyi]
MLRFASCKKTLSAMDFKAALKQAWSSMFDDKELRYIKIYLIEKYERDLALLAKLDEDSDDYIELANDLMLLECLIFKFTKV